jgi:hypothetical protein
MIASIDLSIDQITEGDERQSKKIKPSTKRSRQRERQCDAE